MDLWVRSQDSETLMKVNRIDKYGLSIIVFDNECRETYLGRYNSEERALEVLDEIQRHLVVINDKNDNYFYVYEMPEN